jgi:hypothetical protein
MWFSGNVHAVFATGRWTRPLLETHDTRVVDADEALIFSDYKTRAGTIKSSGDFFVLLSPQILQTAISSKTEMPNCPRRKGGVQSTATAPKAPEFTVKNTLKGLMWPSIILWSVEPLPALEANPFDDRRAIYNRARAAQLKQLGNWVEAQAANNRIITYAFSNASAHSGGAPVRSWLKSVLRLWGRWLLPPEQRLSCYFSDFGGLLSFATHSLK